MQVNVPRFIQGEGSTVRINALIDSDSNITDRDRYFVYGTHDQGSKMNVEYILASAASPPTEPFLIERFNDFRNTWIELLTSFWFILSGIVGVIVGLLQYVINRRRKEIAIRRMEEERVRRMHEMEEIRKMQEAERIKLMHETEEIRKMQQERNRGTRE